MTQMPFFEHIRVLRAHIIRAFIYILTTSCVAFLFMGSVIKFLERPYYQFVLSDAKLASNLFSHNLTAINVFEVMTMNIKISFFIGLIISIPFIMYEIWKFIKPALYLKERRLIMFMCVGSVFLFYTGIVFGYFLIIPFFFQSALSWASQYANVMLTYQSYFNTLMMMVLIFGIIFEVPVILSLLSLSGIINSNTIKKNRRIAFLISFIVGALLAPPDVISMCCIALPLYGMIEISIFIILSMENKKSNHSTVA